MKMTGIIEVVNEKGVLLHQQPMDSLLAAYTKMWNAAFNRGGTFSVKDTTGTARNLGVYSEYSQYGNYYNYGNYTSCD